MISAHKLRLRVRNNQRSFDQMQKNAKPSRISRLLNRLSTSKGFFSMHNISSTSDKPAPAPTISNQPRKNAYLGLGTQIRMAEEREIFLSSDEEASSSNKVSRFKTKLSASLGEFRYNLCSPAENLSSEFIAYLKSLKLPTLLLMALKPEQHVATNVRSNCTVFVLSGGSNFDNGSQFRMCYIQNYPFQLAVLVSWLEQLAEYMKESRSKKQHEFLPLVHGVLIKFKSFAHKLLHYLTDIQKSSLRTLNYRKFRSNDSDDEDQSTSQSYKPLQTVALEYDAVMYSDTQQFSWNLLLPDPRLYALKSLPNGSMSELSSSIEFSHRKSSSYSSTESGLESLDSFTQPRIRILYTNLRDFRSIDADPFPPKKLHADLFDDLLVISETDAEFSETQKIQVKESIELNQMWIAPMASHQSHQEKRPSQPSLESRLGVHRQTRSFDMSEVGEYALKIGWVGSKPYLMVFANEATLKQWTEKLEK
ncbi:hypothetical protein Ciccas_007724 [Cichlidogyrus casuarinus]|uniref:Uncharacterized protein n=1 Tax=Cichlidogyrus casuarinus TaxID=1844966 RepID=A0ABD2Q244_9PLAT